MTKTPEDIIKTMARDLAHSEGRIWEVMELFEQEPYITFARRFYFCHASLLWQIPSLQPKLYVGDIS
jgi:hypothetical protein